MSVLGTHLYQCTSWCCCERLAAFGFSDFFLKTLSTCLPISWWVIYEHTCPHCAECSAVFYQKQNDPCASPSLFIQFHLQGLIFLFPWIKNVLKGKRFAGIEGVETKTAGALRGIKIHEFKKYFEQWDKCLDRQSVSNREYFEGE